MLSHNNINDKDRNRIRKCQQAEELKIIQFIDLLITSFQI